MQTSESLILYGFVSNGTRKFNIWTDIEPATSSYGDPVNFGIGAGCCLGLFRVFAVDAVDIASHNSSLPGCFE